MKNNWCNCIKNIFNETGFQNIWKTQNINLLILNTVKEALGSSDMERIQNSG